jgi:hypothetical protein
MIRMNVICELAIALNDSYRESSRLTANGRLQSASMTHWLAAIAAKLTINKGY